MSVLMVERKCNSLGEKQTEIHRAPAGTVPLRPLGKIPTSDIERTNQKREQSYQNVEMNQCVRSG
mgnify:FL=1|jgi:hypothetical protein